MIHAEYVEFDQPTGARVRRLEVFGHAGYAPRGQDIVCAGASMLMETLVYVLADCDEAECCAYNEPTGPRVSVKLTGSIFPTDLTAMEFAKTGLALLAERYPANIHYEDKSKDGQEKMVNLQLFAEGCGDGGAAAAAASAADAAPAVQEPALRPAEERLARRSGVLKRSSREEGSPSQSAQSAASSPEGGALGKEGRFRLLQERCFCSILWASQKERMFSMSKSFSFPNVGTCSKQTNIVLNDDHTIESVEVIGGCNGNLKGISRLLKGMKAEDAIARMEGTTCGPRPTSCPDQIAKNLKKALAEM